MTQRDMASHLGVTTVTIRNWRKYKPNLYKIVMKGFAINEAIELTKQNYDILKNLGEDFKIKDSSKKLF